MAGELKTSGINLILALGVFVGLGGCIIALVSTVIRSRSGKPVSGMKVVVAVVTGSALIALQQMMNKAAQTLGFGDVSFDAIAYAPDSLGYAKLSVDAVLTLLRAVGALFFYMGVVRARRALVDGHTGLTARQDIGTGMVMGITGILLLCNPQLLDALQKTLGLTWN
ncbi:TraQ family conjugative transfer protein [Buttiauxella noackiae ATCC 51607]|uniref:TraQ family conjugative transfer protein n=1 Tax=Buttiauxella noackiae ATCC 51607 TaxID=1354255 RepID=A0A1B7HGI1_9ENTR|nr:TraQ family conjugative transfer protein [Buttiauxella noackiae ATCC 51607]